MAARRSGWNWRAVVLDGWVVVLAAVLTAPLLGARGYPLSRDLVFTPRPPLGDAAIGLGTAPARAVPLDAVVAVASRLIGGEALARVAVTGMLIVAGMGAHRLLREVAWPGRLVVAGFAVWNPFVIERLALGQWALLWTYAGLWWLIAAAARVRETGQGWAALVAWLGVASLTPTGGLIGAVSAVVGGFCVGRLRRNAALALVALSLQLPWLVPSLLGAAGLPGDPRGVAAFAARSEVGGPLVSLIGLGGLWGRGSMPVSRAGWLGYLTVGVVLAGLWFGRGVLAGALGVTSARRIQWLGVGGLLLAAASSIAPFDELLRWVIVHVPGSGILRDAQKWAMPFAVWAVASVGAATARGTAYLLERDGRGARSLELEWGARGEAGARRMRDSTAQPLGLGLVAVAVAVACALLPLGLLPDGAATVRSTLTPVAYPDDFAVVAERLVGAEGVLITLPWRSYRQVTWDHGSGATVYDPASRWFPVPVVTSDRLAVGSVLLSGEDPYGAQIEAVVTDVGSGRLEPGSLARLGVRWILVYRGDPQAGRLRLEGLEEVYAGPALALYRDPGALVEREGPSAVKRGIVIAIDLAAALVVLGAIGWAGVRRRSPSSQPPVR